MAFLEQLRAHAVLAAMHLHRVYWYDALPLSKPAKKPLAGGTIEFASTQLAQTNIQLIRDLCQSPYIAVRRGDLAFRRWKFKNNLPKTATKVTISADDVVPNIHQKGVDMRLGLDIAALTLKAHVGAIVLVAGDSDFVPAMKFARREGAQLFLVTLGHSVLPDMLEHADLLLDVRAKPQVVAAAAQETSN